MVKRLPSILLILLLGIILIGLGFKCPWQKDDDHVVTGSSAPILGLDKSPQPMFMNNLCHTGRSELPGPTTPTSRWTYTLGGTITSPSTPIIGANDTIYVPCLDGKLYAINPAGHLRWTFDTGSASGIYASPSLGNNHTIYLAPFDSNKFYAINSDGSLKWTFTYPHSWREDTSGCSAIAPDGTIYSGASYYDGYLHAFLYALSPDGSLKWEFTYPNLMGAGSPAIGPDGTIYLGGGGNAVYALNPDGSLKWRYDAPGSESGFGGDPSLAPDGTVYCGNCSGKLYAIKPDGTLKWTYDTGEDPCGHGICSTPAIAEDGTIYFGSSGGATATTFNNRIYALKPDGTTLLWKHLIGEVESGHDFCDSSPAIDKDGIIYIGGVANGKVYAFNPDGTLRWTYTEPGADFGYSSPAIGSNGTVFITDSNGVLHAIKE